MGASVNKAPQKLERKLMEGKRVAEERVGENKGHVRRNQKVDLGG